MYKWQWKVFSILTMLAMALAMCPPAAVGAWTPDGTIEGIIKIDIPGLNGLIVRAYPVGGNNEGFCTSDSVAYNGSGYDYSISGCDSSLDYKVVAEGDGYTFNPVTVLSGDFSGGFVTADPITSVSRTFSGKVTYTDGVTPWGLFDIDYELDKHDGSAIVFGTATTNAVTGVFTIPGVTDASYIYFPQIDVDGYNFGGDNWYDPPIRYNVTDWNYVPTGNRSIHGYIDSLNGLQNCRAGVTITATAPGALTQTALTDADGGFNMNNLEPLGAPTTSPRVYTITPSKAGCVFNSDDTVPVNIVNGNGSQPIVFKIPDTGIWGNVSTTLGKDVSLAYYLIATYTTNGVSYSNAVNWTNGGYWIQAPPSTGTLTISRVGGPAAFGYETADASRSVTIDNVWKEENFTLVPSRTISGTILGQNAVPVQRGATVDFGYGLKLTPSAPSAAYSIKAQPKLYYLSPVENGINSSTPLRFLANLTTAPAVAGANFTLNLKTYMLRGCLRDFSGNDALVLAGPVWPTPSTSVRFRPATGYGVTLYPAILDVNGCGLGSYYYEVKLPKGIVGALEVDGHTLRGGSIDGINGDDWRDYNLMGPRAITARVYAPNPNLDINGDLRGGNGIFTLRDAATNYVINADSDMQRSYEFTVPMLEAKAYTLNINQGGVPWGYVAQPFPMSSMVAANLTLADYDVPAATGFALVHAPIDPNDPTRPATGGGYFEATSDTQFVQWNYPPMNGADWFQGFEVQVGPATTAFTDVSPAPDFYQPNGDPAYIFEGLTVGTLYRWRVRAVFEKDAGPWMETAPVPTSPILTSESNYMAGIAAGAVNFEWTGVAPDSYSGAALKYVVQYSNNVNFSAVAPNVAVTLPAVTALERNTLVNPAIGTTYYWRVKVQNSAGVDISGWSPTQMFFNRYKNITADLYYEMSDFDSIQFFAANTNASLPPNAHYQVWLSRDDFTNDFFAWTFPRTANIAAPSARQFPNSLPSGTYKWMIGIVNGNDESAPAISGWTVPTLGSGYETIVVP
jgi:hypothetical protein